MNILFFTKSPEETKRLGRKIGALLKQGDIAGLIGELGSGKTCLTQGLMEGLGILDRYKGMSPSFTLITEYKGSVPVYHFDVYRLNSVKEMLELGYEEYFYNNGVSIVEWADKINELLPESCIRIYLEILSPQERRIEIHGPSAFLSEIHRIKTKAKTFTTKDTPTPMA